MYSTANGLHREVYPIISHALVAAKWTPARNILSHMPALPSLPMPPQVQEVCRLVCTRSARLTAAAIAGVLKRLGHPAGTGGSSEGGAAPPRVVIAFDGSVFSKYSKYRCGGCRLECCLLELSVDLYLQVGFIEASCLQTLCSAAPCFAACYHIP